jgi:hypothetical protein
VTPTPRPGAVLTSLMLGLLCLPVPGLAQTARAYLSQAEVGLNQQFVLNVEVAGIQQLDGDPRVPDLSAFAAYLGSGTSTAMQMANGRTSVTLTIQYQFQATAEGSFAIGPVTVPVAGQALTTEPLTIRVTTAPVSRGGGADAGVGSDDLFVTARPSKETVYVNEPVTVDYRIFTRVNVDGYTLTEQPSTAGFWAEDLPDPVGGVEQVVRNGVQYASSVIRRVALFPTSAGRKTLEPLTIEAQVRAQRRSRGFFDDPFFGRSRTRAVLIASEPVELEVRTLPPGEPPGFTGMVGQLEVVTSFDRTDVNTNDALTFRLEITGTGNVRTIAAPELGFPADFEVYPPDVTERVEPFGEGVRGRKVFEYVVVPRAPGDVSIPPVELAYFNSDTDAYTVASSAPITLRIVGDAVDAPAGLGGRRRTGIDAQQDIRFIRIAMPTFRPIGASLVRSSAFWAVLLTPLMAVVGAVAVRRHQDRLRGDVAYARRRRASRLAKQRLATAESLRSPERHRDFHAEVGRALQGFLGDKLNLAEAGLVRDEIRSHLTARGVSDAVITPYLGCLEDCDRQRFAPTEPNSAAMEEMLTRAGQAMTDLDQALS